MELEVCIIDWCKRPRYGRMNVCKTCYQRNWERRAKRPQKTKRDISLEDAFLDLDRMAYREWMEGEFVE